MDVINWVEAEAANAESVAVRFTEEESLLDDLKRFRAATKVQLGFSLGLGDAQQSYLDAVLSRQNLEVLDVSESKYAMDLKWDGAWKHGSLRTLIFFGCKNVWGHLGRITTDKVVLVDPPKTISLAHLAVMSRCPNIRPTMLEADDDGKKAKKMKRICEELLEWRRLWDAGMPIDVVNHEWLQEPHLLAALMPRVRSFKLHSRVDDASSRAASDDEEDGESRFVVAQLDKIIASAPLLERILWRRFSFESEEAGNAFLRGLWLNPSLRVVHLSFNRRKDKVAQLCAFGSEGATSTSLKALLLSRMREGAGAVVEKELVPFLHQHAHIEALSLLRSSLGSPSLIAALATLAPTIAHLDLGGTETETIGPLCEWLTLSDCKLRSLGLSRLGAVDREVFAALWPALKTNRSLEWLDVSRNGFNDADIDALVEAIVVHPSITTLGVYDQQFATAASMTHLARTAAKLRVLNCWSLEGDENAKNAWVAAAPASTVTHLNMTWCWRDNAHRDAVARAFYDTDMKELFVFNRNELLFERQGFHCSADSIPSTIWHYSVTNSLLDPTLPRAEDDTDQDDSC